MTYVEGQEVEVWGANMYPWRKAKILTVSPDGLEPVSVSVIFSDGTRAVFDEDHIRPIAGRAEESAP